MNQRIAALAKEASLLKPEDRLELIERILETVRPSIAEVDKAWLAEAERRWAAYERGEIETYDADEVLAELRARSALTAAGRSSTAARATARRK